VSEKGTCDMNNSKQPWTLCAGLALATILGACAEIEQTGQPIEVDETNSLGIVSIAMSRWDRAADRGFELLAHDATGAEVARVQLRSGTIADLPQQIPGSSTEGSELVVSAAAHEMRSITREVDLVELGVPTDPVLAEFLDLTAVRRAVEEEPHLSPWWREAGIAGEREYFAYTCYSNMMLTTPLAKQCGFGTTVPADGPTLGRSTNHVNPLGSYVKRRWNMAGYACKAQDGTGSCSGTNCYFGPHGFGRAMVTAPSTGYKWIIHKQFEPEGFYWVYAEQITGTPVPEFSDVTGSLATGGGCCVNGTGPCDLAGKPQCTSCGGGGLSGSGTFDY
jgi:hypothetical protein